jgi:hypothetical protein
LALPASAAGLVGIAGAPAAEPAGGANPAADRPPAPGAHRIFFVVPKDARTFDEKRRSELGILGRHLAGWPARKGLEKTEGFSAWLTPDEAAALAAQPDVAGVEEVLPENVVVVGRARSGFMTLRVVLTPNNWPVRPDPKTFLSAEDVAREWSRQFAQFRSVKVQALGDAGEVFVTFSRVVPDQVIDALKGHPQVSYMEWVAGATTSALGEEGGRPPQPTTYAFGEEGGVTTSAFGEEGGYPPTTTRFGEEGGITTQALGEEGGKPPTTYRLGEEGGTPPTTYRLGEEGGTPPTTDRLGEEGGTWSPTKPAPTTLAFGEEGGALPPGTAPGLPGARS